MPRLTLERNNRGTRGNRGSVGNVNRLPSRRGLITPHRYDQTLTVICGRNRSCMSTSVQGGCNTQKRVRRGKGNMFPHDERNEKRDRGAHCHLTRSLSQCYFDFSLCHIC